MDLFFVEVLNSSRLNHSFSTFFIQIFLCHLFSEKNSKKKMTKKKNYAILKRRGYGGMVEATDLRNF